MTTFDVADAIKSLLWRRIVDGPPISAPDESGESEADVDGCEDLAGAKISFVDAGACVDEEVDEDQHLQVILADGTRFQITVQAEG